MSELESKQTSREELIEGLMDGTVPDELLDHVVNFLKYDGAQTLTQLAVSCGFSDTMMELIIFKAINRGLIEEHGVSCGFTRYRTVEPPFFEECSFIGRALARIRNLARKSDG